MLCSLFCIFSFTFQAADLNTAIPSFAIMPTSITLFPQPVVCSPVLDKEDAIHFELDLV